MPGINRRLEGWQEIADYLKRTVRTVIRWEKERGLPTHRVPGGSRSGVFAYTHEIDTWLEHGDDVDDEPISVHADIAVGDDAGPLTTQLAPSQNSSQSRKRVGRLSRKLLLPLAAAIAILSIGWMVYRYSMPRQYYLVSERQITNDGSSKENLVTDGKNIYFGEHYRGRIRLMVIPAEDGEKREIPTPFLENMPIGISADKQQVMVLANSARVDERELWAVPVAGGQPRRLGERLCHSAAWSPDGKYLAIASGNSIYLSADDGTTQQLLHTFAAMPAELHWSQDGRRLLLVLADQSVHTTTLCALQLGEYNRYAVTAIMPVEQILPPSINTTDTLNAADDTFLSESGFQGKLLTWQHSRLPWIREPAVKDFTRMNSVLTSIAADPEKQIVYVLKSRLGDDEINEFEPATGTFKLFMPGVVARDVNYSYDKRQFVYVTDPKSSLWVSNADGSSQRQLIASSFEVIELPRWSPDGKFIAFMAMRPGLPYRIYIVRANGGEPKEASHGTDNQGAPTWSPDGKTIVYGRVNCQEDRSCAIGKIDVKTGVETIVPGTEGFSTARWSPDGRYIAALNAKLSRVMLMDRKTGQWRVLADGVNGNNLEWSRNSQFLYAGKSENDGAMILRIQASTGKSERAVELSGFSRRLGIVDMWFTTTPENSILFVHEATWSEIYALQYAVR